MAPRDEGAVRDELGDLLFAVVNVARHLKVDPEAALREATAKFRRRFLAVEALAAERGSDLSELDLGQLDLLWEEVKAASRRLSRSLASACYRHPGTGLGCTLPEYGQNRAAPCRVMHRRG